MLDYNTPFGVLLLFTRQHHVQFFFSVPHLKLFILLNDEENQQILKKRQKNKKMQSF